MTNVILSGPIDVVLGVFHELDPMGNPASYAGNCEKHWIHVSWEAHSSVNKATVEVNIGIELSANKVFIF